MLCRSADRLLVIARFDVQHQKLAFVLWQNMGADITMVDLFTDASYSSR